MTSITEAQVQELEEMARKIRVQSLRMIHGRQAGHPGGSLSAAEILAALYFRVLRIDPANPDWPERDRFILSKGHASSALYSTLALRGFFPVSDLAGWGKLECDIQGHPDRLKTPGVDMTSGILGHGIPIGVGLALAARQQGLRYRVYTLLGDGECQAGIVWEGASTAARFRLANLTAIVDFNDVQLDGPVHEIMPMEPMAAKWRAFGWHVLEINGHNMRQVVDALESVTEYHEAPVLILAHTTKGKGVSFMENLSHWHGNPPNDAQLAQALHELGEEG